MSHLWATFQSLCRSGKGIFNSSARFGSSGFHPTILFAICIGIVLCVVGCAPPTTQPPPLTSTPSLVIPTQAIANTPAAEFPRTATDALGRSVTISARPQRIVSLAPSVTEILFAIGAGPQMVGRTKYDNYPAEAAKLPDIGGYTVKTISVEAIVNLKPDLVIAGTKSQKDVVDALSKVGIPVYTVAPATITEIEDGIMVIGEITGNANGAQTVVADMKTRIAAVTAKTDTIPAEKQTRVFYEAFAEPLTTTSDSTFIGELLKFAGAKNIFGNLDAQYPQVSVEQIVAQDPQAILAPSSAALTVEKIRAQPGWEKITAVKNGAVYTVDGDMVSRAGPRVVNALESIAQQLYPNLFK